jgi:tellurite resistance protein
MVFKLGKMTNNILHLLLIKELQIMFLTKLQQEEKEAFLELAYLMATIDGKFSVFENPVIMKYQKEMDLEDYKIKGLAIDDILKVFKQERSKHIVLIEILRIVYSDGIVHENEQDSIRLIKEHFGFDPNKYASFKDWIVGIKELANYPEHD